MNCKFVYIVIKKTFSDFWRNDFNNEEYLIFKYFIINIWLRREPQCYISIYIKIMVTKLGTSY